jgi:hypothetical protein
MEIIIALVVAGFLGLILLDKHNDRQRAKNRLTFGTVVKTDPPKPTVHETATTTIKYTATAAVFGPVGLAVLYMWRNRNK